MFRLSIRVIVIAPLLTLVCVQSLWGQTEETVESRRAFEWFEREIRPIFAQHCSSCHDSSVGELKGEFSLESRETIISGGESGPAIVPGKPEESLLIEAVRRESFEMPPEKPLPAREIRKLEQWIQMGAPWPPSRAADSSDQENWVQQRLNSHWAWQPLGKVEPPSIRDDNWSANAIDRFILQRLREHQLTPTDESDPATTLRRLSFDLLGLPPDRELSSVDRETVSTSSSAESDGYDELVEQLLSSPQFGVRWGRHWLDLVRYAETLGHEFDYPVRYAWRYRDAVIDSYNVDVPYDQFVREHIVGDKLEAPRTHTISGINQSLALTGFWWLGDSVHAPVDIKNDLATRVDNQIDVLTKTFLGMTVSCSRCHDHKFDAISLRDYYGLSGVIESTRREYAITDPRGELVKHWSHLSKTKADADKLTIDTFSNFRPDRAAFENWVSELTNKLEALDPKELKQELPLSHPLYALRALVGEDEMVADTFQELGERANQAAEQYESWESTSVLLADFSQGLPDGWQLSPTRHAPYISSQLSRQWHAPESRQSFDWFSETLPLPNRTGIFSSQKFGRSQSVLLRSPDFELTHSNICLKMRGKSTQSSVVLNNYFMNEFHSLLFKDTRKPIDQPHDSGWVVHAGDLNKYLGLPAYLSLYDEDMAWFEIAQVRLADSRPPESPHKLTLRLTKQDIQTREQLLSALTEACQSSFAGFVSHGQYRGENEEIDESSTSLVRSMLRASVKHELPIPAALERLPETVETLRIADRQSPPATYLLVASEGTPRDIPIATSGNPHKPGTLARRGCFEDLATYRPAAKGSSGRAELADALTDPRHPLTARVMVNRIWYHLMGRGIVNSPDNLGVLGGRPSHPQLLDYLAAQLIDHDWSIKWLVREIVSSKTYRLSSVPTERQRELDPSAEMWSYRPVRRLSAEAVRDALLMTSNSLDIHLSGESVPVHLNDQMTGRGRPKNSGPLDGNSRRSIFVEVRRNFLDPFLLAFDFPMPSTSAGKRTDSNVPAQALGLLNDPLVLELASRWSLNTDSIVDPSKRIETMIASAFGRPATLTEIRRCLTVIDPDDPESWTDLAHVLFNSKEFSFLR